MTGDCSNGLGGKPPRGTTIQQQEALASAAVPCPRKQVPHAIDSPRPPQKGKRVMWEKQQPENNDIRAEEEGSVCEDPTGRKGMLLKHGGARKNVHVVVKGKLQWLFEQDRLYWEVPTKDNVKGSSSSPHATASSDDASPPTESELIMKANVLNGISPDGAPWCPVDQLSDSVNVGEDYQEDGDLQVGCSSTDDDDDTNDGSSDDDESRNFDLEMSHLEMNAPEIEVFITTPQAPGVSVMAESSDGFSGFASIDDEGSSCFEARGKAINKEQEWKRQAAILKAKCKVLKMEKALVQQRWKEGCKQMMQAVEMAHSLRAAVESILKPLQNTVTASSQPCSSTPWSTVDKENESAEGLVERLQRLQACSDDRSHQQQLDSEIQLHLEQQQRAKASLPEKGDKLQCKSRLHNKEPSNFHNTKEKCEKQRSQRARTRTKSASISSMSLKTIKKENKVKALDEKPLNSMSAKAQKSKTAIDRLLKQTEAGYNILEEDQAKEVQTMETVRKILAQIQVEAEQWTQVQDVLKHVCTEMTTLQQACQGWEKRALNAESQSVACQLERDEWQVKAQTAQQRMKELEVQLVQIQETVQKLKLCHAQEQNQWLDVGSSSVDPSNILGYTLALEPISNTNSSDSGGCKILKEFEGCRNCGKLCHIMVEERQNLDRFGLLCDRHSIRGLVPRIPSPCRQHSSVHGSVPGFPSSCRQHPSAHAHGSLPRYPSPCVQHPLSMSVPRVQSPRRSAIQETSQLRKIPRCMKHNTQHQQLITPVTADNARTIAQQSSSNWKLGMKNDIMRSSSQEESQQTQTRWQKGPAEGHNKKSENQENTNGNANKSFAGMQRKGGAVQGHSLMRKVHQFPVGSNSRQPYHSASSTQDALPQNPLKEVSANVIPCRN